jgi:hypothetical protein
MEMDKQDYWGIIGAILVILGLVLIPQFFSFLGSQLTGANDKLSLFYLSNCEENKSHTVFASVIYANGTRSDGVYTVPPGKTINCMENTLQSNEILDFHFTVDAKSPTSFRLPAAPGVSTGFFVCDSKGNNSVSHIEFNE